MAFPRSRRGRWIGGGSSGGLPAAVLAALTNAGFRMFGGRMAVGAEFFDNSVPKTWQVVAEVPAGSFAFIRPILANGNTAAVMDVGGLSIAAAPSPSNTDVSAATQVQVLIGGASTGSVPAASGATSFRRNYKLGDRTALASVPRTDGGTRPVLVINAYISTASTISPMGNGAQDFTNWASRTDGNRWQMRYNDGNCCAVTGTPGNFISTTNRSQCPIVGFVFETADGAKVCTIVGQGNSITEGQGTYIGEGFGLPACEALHILYPTVAFTWANSGWSGSGVTSFQPRLTDMYVVGLVPDVAIFPNGSPNTNPPIIAATITAATSALDACNYQSALYGVHYGAWAWLPTDPSQKDWNASDSLRVAWNTTTVARTDISVSDFSTALSGITDGDGQVNMLAGSTSDGIHPNDAGNLILKPLTVTLTNNIFTARYTYDPLAARFFEYLNSLGSLPDASRRGLYDTWYRAMRIAGLLTRMDTARLFAAASTDAAKTNLINPGVNTLVLIGSPVFTADRGYQGDGTTSKLDEGIKASATTHYAQDSAHASVYSGTAAQGASSTDFGNSNSVAVLRNGTNQLLGRLNASTNVTIAGVLDGSGMFTLSRTASNLTTIYRNASSIGTSAVASGAVDTTNNICTFGRGGSAAFSNRLALYSSLGDAFSGADATAEYNSTLTFLQAIGAV